MLFDCLTARDYSKTLQDIWIGIPRIRTILAMLTLPSAIPMVKLRCFAISGRPTGSSELRPSLSQSCAGQRDCSASPRVRAVAVSARSQAVADYLAVAHDRPCGTLAPQQRNSAPSSSAVAPLHRKNQSLSINLAHGRRRCKGRCRRMTARRRHDQNDIGHGYVLLRFVRFGVMH